MHQDPHPPERLREIQEWFAHIITQPIDEDSRIAPFAPSGNSILQEAEKYIAPSKTLKSFQRIELYNQQYWWRLLKILHEGFPLLVRLFGYTTFNQTIGMPYLQVYLPNHWSLIPLGNRLPLWLEENYYSEDRELVLNAALIDQAYNDAFFSKQMPPLNNEDLQGDSSFSILKVKLYLQPHVHLFTMTHHLFAFRKEMLKEAPEYWEEQDFPQLEKEKPYCFILYRRPNFGITWEEISPTGYAILQKISRGTSIEHICKWLESQESSIQEEAAQKLSSWFQEWSSEHILTKFTYKTP